jgi:hypothetical protein
MIRYLNSPLKIFGAVLIVAGAFFVIFLPAQIFLLGLSLLTMGVMIHFTEWLMEILSVKNTQKKIYEYLLLAMVVFFLLAIALDYFGVIRMQRYL